MSRVAADGPVVPSIDPQASFRTETHRLPDGRTLAYAAVGDPDGAPVLVHHGTPGSRMFAALFEPVARDVGARLLVPDRPGYGRSSPPPSDWTWSDWCTDCTDLLAAESLDSVATLGFSGGGPFAIATGHSERVSRVGLVGTVVPPSRDGLAALGRVPVVLRVLFGLFGVLASVAGPGAVVGQYTDRDLDEAVSRSVAAEFDEALRQGTRAPTRENRHFATVPLDSLPPVPIRAWHGTRDENVPLSSVEPFLQRPEVTARTPHADHLGTLLDCRREALTWLAGDA